MRKGAQKWGRRAQRKGKKTPQRAKELKQVERDKKGEKGWGGKVERTLQMRLKARRDGKRHQKWVKDPKREERNIKKGARA